MTRRLLPALFALALGSAALLMVMRVHAAGQTLLATTLMVITALALWTYTSARTQALRYLFPGIAAALVFVIFPMLYTIGIGFTNYSSRNLLEPERVRAYLLEERVPAAGSAHAFTLHATAGGVRLQLVAPDGTRLASSALNAAAVELPLSPAPPPVKVAAVNVNSTGAAPWTSGVQTFR